MIIFVFFDSQSTRFPFFSPINHRRLIEMTVSINLFGARIKNKANKQQIVPYFSQSTFCACYKMFASVKMASQTPARVELKFLRFVAGIVYLFMHFVYLLIFCCRLKFTNILYIFLHEYLWFCVVCSSERSCSDKLSYL